MEEGLFIHPHRHQTMGWRVQPCLMVAMLMCASLSGCLFEDDGTSSSEDVLAVFSMNPSSNVRVGDTVSFDGGDSTPQDGSLTYRWNFDTVDSTDIDATGRSATWTFNEAKVYEITLEVSDGSTLSEQTRTLSVVDASSQPPVAEIEQYADSEDCEDESFDESSNIVVWICARDKSQTDRVVTETTVITLDASPSQAGDNSQYITEYAWDLDLNNDNDNDGDAENDADLTGETVDWMNVAPGEYEVSLTITNNVGMVDTDSIRVFVNYAGYWGDFEIGGNSSSGAAEIDYEAFIHYDRDLGNTIRKVVVELEYPKQDDDWIAGGSSQQNRNKLDSFAYNEEDDEATNTTNTDVDSRDQGDCDDEQDCVHMTVSSYMFTDTDSTYGDGEWTFSIKNERWNDVVVDQFVIRLFYK